jgi:beta-lactamase regulating signal transducer with metallopeptidase domain
MNLPFFLEMAWKSSFIAGVVLLLAMLLKSRSPADRATVLHVGLALLVLLPVISLFLPAWQIEFTAAAPDVQPLVGTLLQAQEAGPALASATLPAPQTAEYPGLIIAFLYLGGFAMAAAHLLGGLATLRRWTSEADAIASPTWNEALDRVSSAAGRAPVPLRLSAEVPSPLSWGWINPVILIDAESHERGEDAEAILAHEMAHVVRRDWPALMLSRIAICLFWFNPLVWLVGRAFVRHAEEAADCRALAQVEPANYAQALLACAGRSSRSAIPANSIATSDLSKRVHAILEGGGRAIPTGSRLCAATILTCLALAGPVSAMKLIPGAAAKAAASLAPIAPEAAAMVQHVAAPVPVARVSREPLAALEAPRAVPAAAPEAPAAGAPKAAAEATAAAPAEAAAPPSPAAPPAPLRLAALAAKVEAAAPDLKDERGSYEAAMREVQAASAEAARAGERAARAGERAAAIARRQARRSMAEGAVNMERGAENMKQGARNMAEEAVKLRNPAYREQQIAREALRGRTVTHQQLIDAIPQMEKGSRDMLKGAEDMRRGAEQMRRSAEE